MSSMLIFENLTKQPVLCYPEMIGNEFNPEHTMAMMMLSPAEYSYIIMFETMNIVQFNAGRYIDADNVIHERPEMSVIVDKTTIVADGIDMATIIEIPNPSTVTVGEQSVIVGDGVLELTFDAPDDYLVRIESWPYLDYEVTIHAT